MGSYLVGQGHAGYQTAHYRRPKDAHAWWWTKERDDKLRYVMEKYDDVAKAARVLGIGVRSARWRWREINLTAPQNPPRGSAA